MTFSHYLLCSTVQLEIWKIPLRVFGCTSTPSPPTTLSTVHHWSRNKEILRSLMNYSPFLLASGGPSLEWPGNRQAKGWAWPFKCNIAHSLTVLSSFYWEFGQCPQVPWVVLCPRANWSPEQTVRGEPVLHTGRGTVSRRCLIPVTLSPSSYLVVR